MRIALLGGTGRTGAHFVRYAQQADHDLQLLVRSSTAATELAGVKLVRGTLEEDASVQSTIAGADVVVDLTGPSRGSPPGMRARAAITIIQALRMHSVQRFVGLTGAGVRIPDDNPGVMDRIIRQILKVTQGAMLADAEAYVGTVAASDLDWTVVRAPRLTNAAPLGDVRVAGGVGDNTGTQVSRADLAQFILGELERPAWVHRYPVVTR